MPKAEISREIESLSDMLTGLRWVEGMIRRGLKSGPVVVALRRPKRSDPQNRKMWAMLQDIAEQVEWHGLKLTPEDWKEMCTAALRKQRAVPGIDGASFVVLGSSTRKMSKEEFSELIEVLYGFGAQQGVKWSDEVGDGREPKG